MNMHNINPSSNSSLYFLLMIFVNIQTTFITCGIVPKLAYKRKRRLEMKKSIENVHFSEWQGNNSEYQDLQRA